MKTVVYGMDKSILYIFKTYLDKQSTAFDFVEIGEAEDDEWLLEQSIVSEENVCCNDYDFFIVGSEAHQEEYHKKGIMFGFSNDSIIPAAFISHIRFPWKRLLFLRQWSISQTDSNVEVLRYWFYKEGNLNCIVRIRNMIWNMMRLVWFEEAQIDEVYITDIESEDKCQYNSEGYVINKNDILLNISFINAAHYIPWMKFDFEETADRKRLDEEKRRDIYLRQKVVMEHFWYHDEDYLALLNWKDKRGIVVDLGANFGQSTYAFYNIFENARIMSYEASPELFSLLKTVFSHYNMKDRVELYNIGISGKESVLTWYEPKDKGASGSFDQSFISRRGMECDIKKLSCCTLDKLLHETSSVFFIKMDIEGMELEAIKGGLEIIKRDHPIILLEENKDKPEIIELLQPWYNMYYYDPVNNLFKKEKISGINYWMIPKMEYQKVDLGMELFQQ